MRRETSDYYGGEKAAMHQAAIDAEDAKELELDEIESEIDKALAEMAGLNFNDLTSIPHVHAERMSDFIFTLNEHFLPVLCKVVAMSRRANATNNDRHILFEDLKLVGNKIIKLMAKKELEMNEVAT